MALSNPHILVVDDNEEILSTLTLILNSKSYQVSVKSRLDDFEKAVAQMAPDLIILDKTLGWADGCDLCKAIKSNPLLAHIPVIMFSAYYKIKDECMDAGADEFIEKPFEMKALLQSISTHLARAGKASN